MMGININCKDKHWIEMILNGHKTIETRDHLTLHPYIGQRVGLIKTGCGKAILMGYATISGVKDYRSKEDFEADYNLHRVDESDEFGWHFDTKFKWGYILTDVERCEPKFINTKGIVARRID